MNGRGVIALAVLALAASSIGVLAQETPLPEVRRQPSPTVTAAAECNEPVTPDLRQPVPTPVVTAEQAPPRRAPEPSRQAPPQQGGEVEQVEITQPSRTELTAHESMALLQQKASTASYTEFTSALERARDKVAAMPSGSDKAAFTETLAAYSDVAEIWNYTMTDPMGAFFSDETLPGFHERIAKKYPGYAAFIRPQTLADTAGNQLYPATETRQFLVSEAEKRLGRVRLPPPPGAPPVIAERAPRPAPQVRREPAPTPARPREARPAQPSSATRRTPPAPREAAPTVRREPARPQPAPTQRREPQPVPPEPVTAAPVTAAPVPGTVVEPAEAISTAPEPSTAAVAPPPQQPARPRVPPPAEGRGLSTNTLLLIAFGIIALAAIALMARSLRAKPAEPPSLIPPEPAQPPTEEPLAADTEWLDPETRHWIEDANKTEKPPN